MSQFVISSNRSKYLISAIRQRLDAMLADVQAKTKELFEAELAKVSQN